MFRLVVFTGVLSAVHLSAFALDNQAAKREDKARVLVAQMAAGQFDKAVEPFDETMKQALPADSLKAAWVGLTKQYGPFQRATETRTERIQQYQVVFVTCEFQHGKLDAKVVFSSKNQVAGLFFVPSGRYRPPSYADPSKFEEKEIQVGTGAMASSRHAVAAEVGWPFPGRDPGTRFRPPRPG